jgi:pilus assembly protein Flp/PilA
MFSRYKSRAGPTRDIERRQEFQGEMIMRVLVSNFLGNESGATAVEYGLIVSFIALVVIAGLRTVGTNLNVKFASVSNGLN